MGYATTSSASIDFPGVQLRAAVVRGSGVRTKDDEDEEERDGRKGHEEKKTKK